MVNNYKDSFKATLLFSSVQIYQIIVRVVRSKFIAVLLGPGGMGITSLLRSTTDMMSAATNLGLRTSGVKSIAAARVADNREQLEKTMAVLRRLILLTGLVGTVICAALSPVWSQQSFGNYDYIWSFVAVSLIILVDQLNQGELALLQGLQQRRMLAKANVIGNTLGLFLTIPLYYIWGVKAIVAVMVLSSLLSLSITLFFVKKLKIRRVSVTFRETICLGTEMVKLGFLLSVQLLFSLCSAYFVRNYVSQLGGVEQVGLYSAGSTIINVYLSLVFTSMATDYFPRLATTRSNMELNETIRSQAEIALILLAPIIVAFVVFIRPVIMLLYSDMFLSVETMLYWAMAGTLVKAMAWSLSYSVLAKASPKVFFINEASSTVYTFIFNILGYKYWGLTGFGISITLCYTIYFLQMHFIASHYFNFSFGRRLWVLFAMLNIFVALSLTIKMLLPTIIGYLVGSVLIIISALLSFRLLDKKIDIKNFIKRKICRNGQ